MRAVWFGTSLGRIRVMEVKVVLIMTHIYSHTHFYQDLAPPMPIYFSIPQIKLKIKFEHFFKLGLKIFN